MWDFTPKGIVDHFREVTTTHTSQKKGSAARVAWCWQPTSFSRMKNSNLNSNHITTEEGTVPRVHSEP